MSGDVFKCSFLEGRVKTKTFSLIEKKKKKPCTTGALVIKPPSRCKKTCAALSPDLGSGSRAGAGFFG